jgi:hypothetical protein
MVWVSRGGLWAVLAVTAVTVAGCRGGSAPLEPFEDSQLKEIHELYRHHIKSQKKPPAQLSDLAKQEYEGIYPATVENLRKGKYVVVWGINSEDSGTLLAYEKDVPTKGGAVLMADGSVRKMSPDDFKAAKK